MPVVRWFQQTFLSLACCGLIDATCRRIGGPVGRLLEQPVLLRIGALSYSLYLFHNLTPFLAGRLVPWLWKPPFDSAVGAVLRTAVFAAFSWSLAPAAVRWLEQPVEKIRRRHFAAD